MLGSSPDGGAVSIPFGDAAGRHTLVLGATGSGKTVTQTLMAVRAVERGLAAIVVDPKGDHAMRGALHEAAALAGREFLEWTPSGPSIYNPYAHGSETEIADRLLAGERVTEPHYLRQAQRYLGHAVRALRAATARYRWGASSASSTPNVSRSCCASCPRHRPWRVTPTLTRSRPVSCGISRASATGWRS